MKKLIFLVLLIPILLFSQTETSRFTQVLRNATGQLVTGADVDLYDTGTANKAYDLSEDSNSPGTYYNNSVAHGHYDLYVDEVLKREGIWIGANRVSLVVASDHFDSNGQLINGGVADFAIGLNKLDTSGAIVGEVPVFTGTGVSWDSAAGGEGGGTTKYADEITITESANTFSVKDDGITSEKIGAGEVATSDIEADAIDGTRIADNAVDTEHIAADAVEDEHIAARNVKAVHLSSGSVKGTKLDEEDLEFIVGSGTHWRMRGAYYYNSRTFFAYMVGSGSSTVDSLNIKYYDHINSEWSSPVNIKANYSTTNPLDHGAPYVIVVENGAGEGTVFVSFETSSGVELWSLTSSLGSASLELDTGTSGDDYSQLTQNTNGDVWLWYKPQSLAGSELDFGYRSSSYPYSSWASYTNVVDMWGGNGGYYKLYNCDNGDIHIMVNDRTTDFDLDDAYNDHKDIYYLWYDFSSTTWRTQSSASSISLPATIYDMDQVYDTDTTKYHETRDADIVADEDGSPYLLFIDDISSAQNTWDHADVTYYAYYNGGWVTEKLCSFDIPDGYHARSFGCFDEINRGQVVYHPGNHTGTWEMYQWERFYQSSDPAPEWRITQCFTTGFDSDDITLRNDGWNFYPNHVGNASNDIRFYWSYVEDFTTNDRYGSYVETRIPLGRSLREVMDANTVYGKQIINPISYAMSIPVLDTIPGYLEDGDLFAVPDSGKIYFVIGGIRYPLMFDTSSATAVTYLTYYNGWLLEDFADNSLTSRQSFYNLDYTDGEPTSSTDSVSTRPTWTLGGHTLPYINSGYCVVDSGENDEPFATASVTQDTPYTISWKYKISNVLAAGNNAVSFMAQGATKNTATNNYLANSYNITTNTSTIYLRRVLSESTTNLDSYSHTRDTDWHTVKVVWSDDSINVWFDDSKVMNTTTLTWTSGTHINLSNDYDYEVHYDSLQVY